MPKQYNIARLMSQYYPSLILDDAMIDKLNRYIELLQSWNATHNLVRYKTVDDLIIRHIIDSAQIYHLISPEQVVIDFGSGAGFPGIILSLLGIKKIYLIESNSKKATFLRFASMISDNEVVILNRRIEEINDIQGDVITSRALAHLTDLLKMTRGYLTKSGFCLFIKGEKYQQEIAEASQHYNFQYEIFPSVTHQESGIVKLLFNDNITGT